jgi:hypothetical protein
MVPLNERVVAGGSGSTGLGPLQAARTPNAAATAKTKTNDLIFMASPPVRTFNPFALIISSAQVQVVKNLSRRGQKEFDPFFFFS